MKGAGTKTMTDPFSTQRMSVEQQVQSELSGDERQRQIPFYGMTIERILIVSGLFNRKVKSLNMRTLSDLSLSQSSSGEGSISFGSGFPFGSWFGGFSSWPGMEAYLGPRFELIPNAKGVYEIIRNAQRSAA